MDDFENLYVAALNCPDLGDGNATLGIFLTKISFSKHCARVQCNKLVSLYTINDAQKEIHVRQRPAGVTREAVYDHHTLMLSKDPRVEDGYRMKALLTR